MVADSCLPALTSEAAAIVKLITDKIFVAIWALASSAPNPHIRLLFFD